MDRFPAPWTPTDPPSAARLNSVLDFLRPLSNMTGGGATQVFATPDGTTVYTPEPPASSRFKVGLYRLDRAATGGGKYYCKEILPAAGDVSDSVNLNSASFGTAGTKDVLLLNSTEEGQTTHDLTFGTSAYPQVFVGVTVQNNSDGTKVVALPGFQVQSCPASGAPSPSDGGAGASYALIGI